jgi:hypothetical protein
MAGTEPGWTDNVARMQAWVARHPGAEYHGPLTLHGEHAMTWTPPSADPARDGEPRTESHPDLGLLMDLLEATDRLERR